MNKKVVNKKFMNINIQFQNQAAIKKRLYCFVGFIMLIFMIAFPSLTLEGSKQGLTLWFQNLLPALFPYTILSSYILGISENKAQNRGSHNVKYQPKTQPRLLKIPVMGYFAIFTGLLCGYPLGAKITAQLISNNKLSTKEGQYLIGFCNLASPSFLIQYVTTQSLGSLKYLPAVLLSVYGSAIITALITYPLYLHKEKPLKMQSQRTIVKNKPRSYTGSDAIMESFEAMVRLGGYLVLFSIIAKMVTALFTTVTTSHFFLIGVIEITNGVHFIAQGNLPDTTKLLLLAFCVAFGGFSCFAQSAGMCQSSGLSMAKYFITKLMNGCIAFALMYLWCKGD